MVLDTLSSWVTVGMCFALAVILLWSWHQVMHQGNGAHRVDRADDWDLIEVTDD